MSIFSHTRNLALRWLPAAGALLLAACQPALQHAKPAPPSLIPVPANLEVSAGKFTLREGAVLNVRSDNPEAIGVARYFADLLARTRALHLDIHPLGGADRDDGISFVLDPRLLVRNDSSDEGYELTVSSRHIVVAARTAHGLFNGSITLWQLLTQTMAPASVMEVGDVHIEDHPRFSWRGLMLDSARHYQSPEFIKQLLDQMAQHKLNVFHWHLTDDQGWRIQIKKYPRLTEVGAWRIPASTRGTPPRYGGFYTQDQIRDIVRYAAQRYITIVPEMEMPGHAQAAIAAYPELGVTGKAPPVSHDWGVHTYLYNVDESTFGFLQDVLAEVMELFPGSYIHIGGDEAAKDQWQASPRVQQRMHELGLANEDALQSWFVSRIERYLGAHGRKLLGWDEILQGGLPPQATVMSWRGTQGAVEAARLGHDAVMAPSPVMYFDHVQSDRHAEPPGRPDVVSLADVYSYEPAPLELDALQARHVLGAQANLWTEYMDTPQRVEHAAFPRAAALAEVLWSPQKQRSLPDFLTRLPAQLDRYRGQGVDFADSSTMVSSDTSSHPRRNSDELQPCKPGQGLPLRLPGPALGGGEATYHVDIFDPCWIYPRADLDAMRRLDVVAAELPYKFQLWKDLSKVVVRKPQTPAGELQIRLDGCEGNLLATIALPATTNTATLQTPLQAHGVHDLCLTFTRAAIDPMWAIDTVELSP